MDPFIAYDLLVGAFIAAGTFYLLSEESHVGRSRRPALLTALGVLAFAVGGPICGLVLPEMTHLVHGTAALVIAVGLYGTVRPELEPNYRATVFAEKSPRWPRWMVPMDDAILDLFHPSNLVLTPAVMAYNLDSDRDEVASRLSKLVECGYLERTGDETYRLTPAGKEHRRTRRLAALDDS